MKTFAITCLVVVGLASTGRAATTLGVRDDGKTSVAYDAQTGRFTMQPDGQAVGLYQITSASGIFSAGARVPPGGLGFNVDTATEKAWAALTASAINDDFDLGTIGPAGLSQSFLLSDLSLIGSGGFGTPNRAVDLVYLGFPLDGWPIPIDAHYSGYRGTQFTHQFQASSGVHPISWSNLKAVPGSPIPTIAPTLSASGLFTWNSAGSPYGVYGWDVTATNVSGSDVGRLAITLHDVPEPGTICLACAVVFAVLGMSGRRKQASCRESTA